ncbi:SDR family NAD(P)-dependent oxidoreductase [Rhizohabitans arisaemae]|uniref:SDR family NAD(P)-dependent oxidoreductase n=1 Tax=Rhizohabitans arisaemae TaxID=2720610 RepID=UPI0024B0EA89|nr:SDR family oxidoreductase [Rhizohabitans arisaemae]
MDIKDRVVIVTGAASGMGAATAGLLASRGAKVVLADISDSGAEVAEGIRRDGGDAEFVRTDVGRESDAEALVAATLDRYGKLDGAFNNAGIEMCSLPLHKLTGEQWERAIRVDLTGVFNCLKYEIIAMLESGGGSIVNTASAAGQVAIPNAAEYTAAKHGVVGLTKAAAADYGKQGIRVNAILPGTIETPMVARAMEDPTFQIYAEGLLQRHALHRFGKPGEIGESVAWLLSDGSSFVTGAAIPVDGGWLAT